MTESTQTEKNEVLLEFTEITKTDIVVISWSGHRNEQWLTPDGRCIDKPDFYNPDTGLSLLFKWVVPKMTYYCIESDSDNGKSDVIAEYGKKEGHSCDINPTKALADACYEAVKGMEDKK